MRSRVKRDALLTMSTTTIIIGLLLIMEGILGFLLTGATHFTALIPAGFGLVITLSGILARKEKLHMHAMHAAVLFALIGFAATSAAFSKISLLIAGAAGEKTVAYESKIVMAILCGTLLVLGIRSFVIARLLKKQGKKAY
ncbi:MAG: hypothetical protein RLZZ408_654 [Verrucomicrobiota bacterium]